MQTEVSRLFGFSIHGKEDRLGKVHDLYFDDVSWKVSFLVADTRHWLVGRFALVSPVALGEPDSENEKLPTTLTRESMREAPGIEEHKPVSRQHAADVAKYWDWPFFAPGDPRFDVGETPDTSSSKDDPHLRGARETTGYKVHARDRDSGHVDDWIVDTKSWKLCGVVVDTTNWWPGGQVTIPCDRITSIDWDERTVHVDMAREEIRSSPRPGSGGS